MTKKKVWFEVGDSGSNRSLSTLDEAKEYLDDMLNGFIKTYPDMKEKDRAYWREFGKTSEIYRVEIKKIKVS